MSGAPLILITVADHDAALDAAHVALVNARYADGVRRAGGLPLLISHTSSTEQRATAFARMEGLLLSGGADIDPARYNEPVAGAVEIDTARDALEWEALDAADARKIPVFGICRGLQIMAVAEGGSLHQHLFDVVGDWKHREIPGTFVEHGARFAADSKIAAIFGATDLVVNSSHHQSVKDAGRLTVTGWASDDTIEVCEDPTKTFCVGVQWHPEAMDDTRIFDAFVAVCRN